MRIPGRPGTLRRMPYDRRGAPALLALVVAAVLLAGLAPVANAAEPNYPSRDRGYHSNAEMVAEIRAVQAAHPDLVEVVSIGKSYQGRDIWVAKVSDNVAVDEPEPEVLVDALHHARERLSLEQALSFLATLTSDYATDPGVRALVDARETWIIFSLNPDGHVHDVAGFPKRLWRKNRQPTPGAASVGTDLNRNYDYRWGCCGGSSGNPAAWNYRGPAPFSAPETRALRDFVASRVVDGRQQIRAHITLHTNGEQILWPFGYTKTDVPADMTVEDHADLRGPGPRDGPAERLPPDAVERPLPHRRRPDRLDVRAPPDLLVHLGALPAPDAVHGDRPLLARRDHRAPDGAEPGGLPLPPAGRRLSVGRDRPRSRPTAGPSSTTSRDRRAGR